MNRWVNYVPLEASGTMGGAFVLWDKIMWEREISTVGMYSVTCSFKGSDKILASISWESKERKGRELVGNWCS